MDIFVYVVNIFYEKGSFWAILALFSFIPFVSRQQILGGDITWTCLTSGPNSGNYIFQLTLFNQCDSGNLSTSAKTLTVLNGPISSISCSFVSENNISLPCYNQAQEISCSNSGSGAVSQGTYRSAPVSLSGVPPKSGWKFIYNANNRPKGSNLNGNFDFGLRSIMYPYQNQNALTCYDNSPQFAEKTLTRSCVGYPFGLNHKAFDPDPDLISFSFAEPLDAIVSWPGSPVNFNNGYSYLSPFPSPFHNSLNTSAQIYVNSGEIAYTSYTTGRMTHVFKVSSYRNGILISEIYRDFTMDLVNCPSTSTIPPMSNTPPSGFFVRTGVLQPYPLTLTLIAGDSIEMDIYSYDNQFNQGFIGQKFLLIRQEVNLVQVL